MGEKKYLRLQRSWDLGFDIEFQALPLLSEGGVLWVSEAGPSAIQQQRLTRAYWRSMRSK